VGVVAKSLGNGFFDAVHKGADEAARELDAEVIFNGPTTPTAEGQIEVLNSLIAQRVDAIAVSANDPDALVPTLRRAMERGIKVVSYDSGVAPAGRVAHLAPSSDQLIGETVVALVRSSRRRRDGAGNGKFAVVSATPTSTNQNSWLAEMRKALALMRVSNSSAWFTVTTFPTSRIAKPWRCSSNTRISRCWSASAPSESWPRRAPSKIRGLTAR
jgi:rhamnose transport system substrate-binding protein